MSPYIIACVDGGEIKRCFSIFLPVEGCQDHGNEATSVGRSGGRSGVEVDQHNQATGVGRSVAHTRRAGAGLGQGDGFESGTNFTRHHFDNGTSAGDDSLFQREHAI